MNVHSASHPFSDDQQQHPYYPPHLELPNYVPNDISVPILISSFAASSVLVFATTTLLARRMRPTISKNELLTTCWFALCGCIHFFFEGYYSYNNAHMPSRTHLFGQLWKEYSLSDHRYLTRDPFVVCMETITAVFWGPLSFLIAWFIMTDHPLRYPLQLLVSLGQLYGDVLYYATFFFEETVFGEVFCRPERYYFWGYYVLMNGFWIVFPGCLVLQSVRETGRVFRQVQGLKVDARKKSA